MKLVMKEQPSEILGVGDVIEHQIIFGKVEMYLVIRSHYEDYHLVDLNSFKIIDEEFDCIAEIINYISNWKYRIIKSSNLELREV